MFEYACPRCGKLLLILDVSQSGFNYKVICNNCSYYTYEVDLNKYKEFKHGKETKQRSKTKNSGEQTDGN